MAPVFKSATVILRGNAYPCPERQHHVCCPLSMATLARACLSCGVRKGVGVRGNLTVMGPRVTGAKSAPCPALNGPSGVPRGPSAAGLTHGLHLPLSCGERRPTGPALSLATTTLWWRSGLGQHSPQDAVKPIQDSGTICFFFFLWVHGRLALDLLCAADYPPRARRLFFYSTLIR